MRPPEPVTMAKGNFSPSPEVERVTDRSLVRARPFEHIAEYCVRIPLWSPLGMREEGPAVGEVDRHVAGPRFVGAALDRDTSTGEGAADLRQLDEGQAAASAAPDIERATGPRVRLRELIFEQVDEVLDVQKVAHLLALATEAEIAQWTLEVMGE